MGLWELGFFPILKTEFRSKKYNMSRVTSFFNWIFRHEEKLPLVFILFLLIPIFFEGVKPYRFPMLWILLIVAMLRGYLVELSYPDRTAVFRHGKSWARGDKLFLLIFYLTVAGVVVLLLYYGIAGSLPLLIPLLLMAAYMGIVGTFRNVKRQVLKEQIESQHWVDCLIFTPTVLVICEQAI